MNSRLTLLGKVRLVVGALRSSSKAGLDRIRIGAGALGLPMAPVAAGVAILALVQGYYLGALQFGLLMLTFTWFWALAWRLAVDLPMGNAWFLLPQIRWAMGVLYVGLAVVHVLVGEVTQAGFDLGILALLLSRHGGGGGGGWEDEPVIAPQPSEGGVV